MRKPLALVLLVAATGCSTLVPTGAELTYRTRATPAVALDSVAAWASQSGELVVEREGLALTLRDRRPGQDNVAEASARALGAGVAEVVVRSRYLPVSDARDLGVALATGRPGWDRFFVPLADPDSDRAPCFSYDDWLAAADAAPTSAPAPREVEQINPVLIGGLPGLIRRVTYPEDLRRAGIEGTVLAELMVGTAGEVVCAQVLSSPDERFSSSALAAARASVFEPGRIDGEPVRVRYRIPITFRLR